MSRPHFGTSWMMKCFPRVSGDEPIKAWGGDTILTFSPRERG